MIYIGQNEISGIYLGNSEITGIYCGELQLYPMNLGTLTGIAIENLTWVTDIAASGGTATSANCSFSVYAYYDSGKRKRVNNASTITGSLVVPATSAETRELVGTLTLTASYSGFTDTDTVDVYQKAYSTLPTPFMFNYNAKLYNPVTYTFEKTDGQLFDEDLTLNKAPYSYTSDSVYFGNTQAYTGRTGYTNNNNPFNRDASNCTLTFIYKTSGWTNNDGWTRIFANRYPSGTYNWWILGNRINEFILNCPNYNPQICVIRVNADGSAIRKFLDTDGNVVASATTASMNWYQGTAQGFGFFHGYGNGGDTREYFNKTFYWMFCSLEALTDEEIQQVIDYNEEL